MSQFGDTAQLHQQVMAILWGPVANFSIFIVQYSYRRYPFFIHALFGLLACGITLATAIPMLIFTGIVPRDSTISQDISGSTLNSHYLVGITCLVIISLEVILGAATKIINLARGKSSRIIALKKVHQIFGYMILVLCKANIYIIEPDAYGFMAQDAAFVLLIIGWKLFFPRMEAKSQISIDQDGQTRAITSVSQLSKENQYCVFSNYVYDISPLIRAHPAGFEVIESVKNREIDRYIYGMYSSEAMPEIPKHSHSSKFLSLLDKPLAKIAIASPFEGFESSQVVTSIETIKTFYPDSNIYEMRLKKASGSQFAFRGYETWQQLGRYYSITFNKVTRLYTSVNFLVQSNKTLMRNVFNIPIHDKPLSPKSKVTEIQLTDIPSKKQMMEKSPFQECIPILFKMYEKGKFTESLIQSCKKDYPELVLSEPKGEGLQLATARPGKLIIVAGGTGLYPFSDLIDLLCKELLVRMRPDTIETIYRLSPVLKTRSFDQFFFELILSFRSITDIHPITLEQLIFLSNHHPRFSLTMKIDDQGRKRLTNTKIRFQTGGFDQLVQKELENVKNISKIYVCGPPRMNEEFSKILRDSMLQEDSYLIL